MSDSKSLYFITLIDEALGGDSPELALARAFKKINQLGRTKEYKMGFLQFRAFMKTIVESHIGDSAERKQTVRDAIYQLLYDLVTNSYNGSDKEKSAMIESFIKDENWRSEYERIKSELADFMEPNPPMGIEVMKDDKMIATFAVTEVPINLTNIDPGQYTVMLSNGMILWKGKLLKKHLIWLEAYGDKDLPMAAKTEKDTPQTTLSEPLMGGDMIMDVIPDLQSGEIRFSYGKQRR